MSDEQDRNKNAVLVKVRKRTSKDQRRSDLDGRVITIEIQCQNTSPIANLLNALATETEKYRNGECAEMIKILDKELAPLQIRDLELYLNAARKALAAYERERS